MREGSPLRLLVLVTAIFMLLGVSSARAEKKIALIVGNAQYANVGQLRNPGNDAPDLAATLKSIGFEVILKTNAAKNDFDRALAEFSRKSVGADVALFYYAGHGVQYQGTNYLLPTDIDVLDINDVRFQAVETSKVRDAFEPATGVKILILDACRDNPFMRTQVAKRAVTAPGLTRIDASDGMIVVYATAPNQTALDGAGRNSPFAEALMQRVKEQNVEVTAMFRRVAGDVYERTHKEQRPEFTSNVIGEFFLNPSEGDRVAWDRIRDSQDPAEFRKFIERYPSSSHTREAQRYLDLFEQIRAANEERRKYDARVAAERAEAQRRDAENERAQAQASRDASLAAQQAEALRRDTEEAQRRAAMQAAAEQRAEQARIREAALSAEQAEAARRANDRQAAEETKRLAALEQKDAEKRLIEAKQQHMNDVCQGENAQLEGMVQAQQIEEIEALRKRAGCPNIGISIDRELRKLKVARDQACVADRRALAAVKPNDLSSFRTALDRMSCEPVRVEAQQRVARLEDEQRRTESVCAGELQALKAIDAAALDAQKQYSTFRQKLKCDALRPQVDQALASLKQKTRDAQSELARLGCYTGAATGTLDDTTRASMNRYLTRKGEIGDPRLTDDWLSELKNQNLPICPDAAPVADVPEKSAPAGKVNQGQQNAAPAQAAKPKTQGAARWTPPAKPQIQRVEREAPARPARRVVHIERESAPPPRARAPARPSYARSAPARAMPVAAAPSYSQSYSAPARSYGGGGGGGGGGGAIHGAGF